MRKKYPYYGKNMIINFPGFSHTMGFVAFSHAMGNWRENTSISQKLIEEMVSLVAYVMTGFSSVNNYF